MRSLGGALDSALRRRYEHRGDGTADISYHVIKGGISEMRTRGLLEGVRAIANRVYAGQRWWVEGHRSPKIAGTADTPCSARSRNVFRASVFGTFREHLGHPISYQMC